MYTKAIAILALSASCAIAQPQPDHDSNNEDPSARIKEQTKHIDLSDPVSLRKRLVRTLNFAQRIVEKHEEALAQLDAGEDPRVIMRSLRTPDTRRDSKPQRDHQDRPIPASFKSDPATSQPTNEFSEPYNDHPRQISADDLLRVRDFVTRHLPEVDSKLKQVESLSPPAAEQLLTLLAPKVVEILSLEQIDPTLSDLKLRELKAGLSYTEASRDYRMMLRQPSTNPERLAKAESRVRDSASERFDAQVQIKQYEIHRLTMRIQELHEALDELNAQRDDQVDAQVESAKKLPKNRRGNRPKNPGN